MINFRYQDYLVKFRNLSFLEHQVEEYSKQEQEKLEVRLKLIILHGHDRLKLREISVLNWIQDPPPFWKQFHWKWSIIAANYSGDRDFVLVTDPN